MIEIHSDDVINRLFSDLDRPSKKLSEELGDIMWTDDGNNIKHIARPRYKASHYLVHPGQLMHDLGESGWKSGFLTRVFKMRLNYYLVYDFFKHLSK